MQKRLRRPSLALGLGVAASLAVAAPALAAPAHGASQPKGTVTVSPSEQTANILGREGATGIVLQDPGAAPVEILVGAQFDLPIAKQSANAITSTRTVTILARNGHNLVLPGFKFNTSKGVVKSGGEKIATLSGGHMFITKSFANQLDTVVDPGAFVPGEDFATITVAN